MKRWPRVTTARVGLASLSLFALAGCGDSTDPPTPAETTCPPAQTVATVADLNYPEQDCAEATVIAEGKLDSGHYRRACQASDDTTALPAGVLAARVTDCRSTDGRGVFLDVEICCPTPAEASVEPESVTRAEQPSCPGWYSRASANDLHYPDVASCASVLSRAEAELTSNHYRKACKAAAARSARPARVLEARVVECRSGGNLVGVTIDVALCCEAKVFDEDDFRELVMLRTPEEIRATLGAPERIAEQPPGTHWKYPIEVVRGDELFPGVTLVFVDTRVNSYYF